MNSMQFIYGMPFLVPQSPLCLGILGKGGCKGNQSCTACEQDQLDQEGGFEGLQTLLPSSENLRARLPDTHIQQLLGAGVLVSVMQANDKLARLAIARYQIGTTFFLRLFRQTLEAVVANIGGRIL